MTPAPLTPDVLISEVGPRDGLQSVQATMPTAHKFAWIDALHVAGLREIEVCSFVPARLLPQMADAAEVVAQAITLPSGTTLWLLPQRAPPAANKPICPITGGTARYRDPLTGHWYSDAEAYRELRRRLGHRGRHAQAGDQRQQGAGQGGGFHGVSSWG